MTSGFTCFHLLTVANFISSVEHGGCDGFIVLEENKKWGKLPSFVFEVVRDCRKFSKPPVKKLSRFCEHC